MANIARQDNLINDIRNILKRLDSLERRTVVVGVEAYTGGGGGGPPTGAAGGVLGGTYPNPSFASDMATQAELDAHAADTTSVHGISNTANLLDTTDLSDINADIADVVADLATHEADTTSVHGISNTANLAYLADLAAHEADTTSIHGISNTANLAYKNADNAWSALQTFNVGIDMSDNNIINVPISSDDGEPVVHQQLFNASFNLAKNSSFELDDIDEFWGPNLDGGAPTLEQSSEDFRFGDQSAKIEPTTAGYIAIASTEEGRATVIPGQEYTASAYIKGSQTGGTTNFNIFLDWYEAGSITTWEQGTVTPVDGTWQRVSVTGVAPAGTDEVEIWIDYWDPITPLNVGDTMFVDGVQLEEGGLTGYAPNPYEILPGTVGTAEIEAEAVTAVKIASHTILAANIAAGAIEADSLASEIILSSMIKTGGLGEDRVEISDIGGIQLIDQDNQTIVSLPIDGSPARFAGQLEASSLTVEDNFLLQGTNNKMDAGAEFEITSQQQPPVAPLSAYFSVDSEISMDYNSGTITDPSSPNDNWARGMFFDTNGNNTTTDTYLVASKISFPTNAIVLREHDASTGSMLRSTAFNGGAYIPSPCINGVCRRGNTIYVCVTDQTNDLTFLFRFASSNLAARTTLVVPGTGISNPQRMAMGTDGTYLCFVTAAAAGPGQDCVIKRYSDDDTTGGAFASHDTKTLTGLDFHGDEIFSGVSFVSSKWWVGSYGYGTDYRFGINSFDGTTLVYDADTGFYGGPNGFTHNGTVFITRQAQGLTQLAQKHTNWTWASSASAYHILTYTYSDNTNETTAAPQTAAYAGVTSTLDRTYRRHKIIISIPSRPTSHFRIYYGRSATNSLADSSMRRQSATSYISSETVTPTIMTDYNSSGTLLSTITNTFPGGDPAEISSSASIANGGWMLTGDTAKGFVPVGSILPYGPMSVNIPTGWLLCDGTAQTRATYPDLVAALITTEGNFTITIASPGVATKTAHGLLTGDQVYLQTTGALPTGLSINTAYYVFRVDANTFRLATTWVNAVFGTTINTSGTQSGTHTIFSSPYGPGNGTTTFGIPNLKTRVPVGRDVSDGFFANLGYPGGAKDITLTTAQLPSHTHGKEDLTRVSTFSTGGSTSAMDITGGTDQTNAAGSGDAHSNMQPYLIVNYIIKT